jgi:hypothetical protein
MRDVSELPIFAFLAGHGDEESTRTLNNFEISDNKALIEGDAHVGLQSVFIDGKYFYFGDFHIEVSLLCFCQAYRQVWIKL